MPARAGSRRSGPRAASRCAPRPSCSPAAPGSPKVSPRALGGRIFPTRQEVFFFGVPKGDARFAPPAMPTWIDFGQGFYGMPDLESRGFKIANDQHGPAFDPDSGERAATPAAPRRGARVHGAALPGHARRAARGGARLPVREHLERRLRDRPPPRATRTSGSAAAARATASSTARPSASSRPSAC